MKRVSPSWRASGPLSAVIPASATLTVQSDMCSILGDESQLVQAKHSNPSPFAKNLSWGEGGKGGHVTQPWAMTIKGSPLGASEIEVHSP